MQTPAVYVNHTSSICIVTEATGATVKGITFEGDIKAKTMEFLKDYRPLMHDDQPYNVAKAAKRMLNNRFQTPSEKAIKALKEIIMSNSNVITVTKTAEFIGRFPDAITAAECSPNDAICISSAEDFDKPEFTKLTLMAALNIESKNPDKFKKADLAQELYRAYSTREIEVNEPKKREPKRPKAEQDKKPRERSHKDRLRDLFVAGYILTEQEILDRVYGDGYATTEFTVRTAINNLKSEKHCDKEGVLNIVSGKMKGIRVYCLETTPHVFDLTKAQAKIVSKGKGQPTNDDQEIDNSDQQIALPLS